MKTDELTMTESAVHVERLRTLIKAFRLVSVSLDLEETLNGILRAAKKLINYDAAGIFVIDPADKLLRGHVVVGYEVNLSQTDPIDACKGIIGRACETGEGVVIKDVNADPDYIRAREGTRSELATPIIGSGDKVIGVINLESDLPNAYDETDLQLLGTFASMVAIAIEKADLHQELMKKRRLEYELQVASQVMNKLMPTRAPQVKNFSLFGRSIASRIVGGDYFDFIDLGEGRCGLIIADVSGKGIPAALIMASCRAYVHALLADDLSLRGVFRRLNQLLIESTEGDHFVTTFFAKLDPEERRIFYLNAGHNPPLLIRPGQPSQTLSRGGIPLGIFDSAAYSEDIVYLEPGDTLILYTDGITEATNSKEEIFGLHQLEELVRRHLEMPVNELCQRIIEEVNDFSNPGEPSDDLTVVVIRAD